MKTSDPPPQGRTLARVVRDIDPGPSILQKNEVRRLGRTYTLYKTSQLAVVAVPGAGAGAVRLHSCFCCLLLLLSRCPTAPTPLHSHTTLVPTLAFCHRVFRAIEVLVVGLPWLSVALLVGATFARVFAQADSGVTVCLPWASGGGAADAAVAGLNGSVLPVSFCLRPQGSFPQACSVTTLVTGGVWVVACFAFKKNNPNPLRLTCFLWKSWGKKHRFIFLQPSSISDKKDPYT